MSITAKSESGVATQSAFSWTFPGAPIRINMPFSLISKLRAELDEHGNSAGGEIGGVLLGHQKTQTTLEIDDYVWVSSEQQPGGRYNLNPSELERLRSLYTARDENAGPQSLAVGYFRTHSEASLHLRDKEIGFVGKHFRDPTNAVLLIRTSPKPYTAGFFFWMNEGVFAPFSFMDFPLDAELLRLQAKSRSTGALPTEKAEAALPLPATIDEDPVAPVESASIAVDHSIAAPAEDVKISLRLKSHSERPWERNPNSAATGGQIKPIEPAVTKTPRTAAPPLPQVSQRTLAAAGVVIVVLALVGLSAYLLRSRRSSEPIQNASAPVTAAVAAFPLQLEVQAQGDGLNVRWNPQSAPAIQAREGHLVILEGDQQPRIIPLDPQQLTSGHVYYRSTADRLQFQLEIVDTSGRVSKESVLALSSKPSPAVTPVAQQQAAYPQRQVPSPAQNPGQNQVQTQARKVESIPIPSTDPNAVRLTEAMETLLNRKPAPRTFTAPPSGGGRAEQVPAITLDQAPVVASNNTLPPAAGFSAAFNNLPANNLPPPPAAPVKPAPVVSEPPAPQPLRVGGNLQAANLIKRVTPVYPPVAMSAHVQGIVRFTALIGKDGTVRNLQLITGNPTLVRAATDAVKQWRYRPTLLNGDPVEVITQIEVNFTLGQ